MGTTREEPVNDNEERTEETEEPSTTVNVDITAIHDSAELGIVDKGEESPEIGNVTTDPDGEIIPDNL